MSRKYERTTLRASWSAEDLEEAMKLVRNKRMGVNEASRNFKIPSRTLRRHLITGRSKVPLGRNPVFSQECEKKLVAHIKKLERVGFAPERKDVKEMAFQLAKSLKIKNPFSEGSEAAGNVWFTGFMARNPELSQRKSEGLSLSRAYGVNRQDIKEFFDLLAKIYEENDFINHPEDVFNMDESGIQINNKAGKVIATKGARDVYTLTSSEKGENVTVIACCNAQGNFLPPVLIYKGSYNKPQFSEGLPPGSQVYMNKKSSYINSDLFMKWFEEVFLRHKSPRKTLLILDGHSSHSNNIRLLEVAKENDVILLCLPSHTTHALQPLDRAFFKPLKVYFAQEAKSWMVRSKDKKLTRYDVAKLIGRAWGKAATISNGVSALKSCGIYPFDPTAIPDHYFALSDSIRKENVVTDEENQVLRESPSILEDESTLIHESDMLYMSRAARAEDNAQIHHDTTSSREITSNSPTCHTTESMEQNQNESHNENSMVVTAESMEQNQNESHNENSMVVTADINSPPSRQNVLEPRLESRFTGVNPSSLCDNDDINSIDQEVLSVPKLGQSVIKNIMTRTPQKQKINSGFSGNDKTNETPEKETPTKLLSTIHPIPEIPIMSSQRKQKAVVLTSTENIEKRKEISNKRILKLKTKGKTSTSNTENMSTKKIRTEEIKATKKTKNHNKANVSDNKKSNNDKTDDFEKTRKSEKKTHEKTRRTKCEEKQGSADMSENESTQEKTKNLEKKRPEKRRRTKNNEKEDSRDIYENELTQDNQGKNRTKTAKKIKRPKKSQSKKRKEIDSSSSETVDENNTDVSEEELSDTLDENKCIECTEDYYKTKSTEDWIPCLVCSGWMHEFCTMYGKLCNVCGRKAKREVINRTGR